MAYKQEPKDYRTCGCVGYDILDDTGTLVGMEWVYCAKHKEEVL